MKLGGFNTKKTAQNQWGALKKKLAANNPDGEEGAAGTSRRSTQLLLHTRLTLCHSHNPEDAIQDAFQEAHQEGCRRRGRRRRR